MYCIALMMEAARASETSVDNYFTRQYIPKENMNFKVVVLNPVAFTLNRG
jgi:hypothetical protein